MARRIHFTKMALTPAQAGMAAMTLVFCAFALFMCASRSRKWSRRWRACYGEYDHEPVIQMNTEAMMVNTGLPGSSHDEAMFSGELWQKNILMGGKCQLPDFSGVILYDSEGNVITPARNPRPLLTWK